MAGLHVQRANVVSRHMMKRYGGFASKLIVQMIHDIKNGNPVLTGKSKNSWHAVRGRHPGRGDPGIQPGPAKRRQENSLRRMRRYNPEKHGTVHIVNDATYVPFLELNHRTHAGFIERGVNSAMRKMPRRL